MSPQADEPAERELRVDEVLRRLEAGVRQRQAELATRPDRLKDLPPTLARLYQTRYLEEPPGASHRPLVGPLIVAAKKVVYQLFLKWSLRPIMKQQNAFNQAVTVALQDLFEHQRSLARSSSTAAGEPPAQAASPDER